MTSSGPRNRLMFWLCALVALSNATFMTAFFAQTTPAVPVSHQMWRIYALTYVLVLTFPYVLAFCLYWLTRLVEQFIPERMTVGTPRLDWIRRLLAPQT